MEVAKAGTIDVPWIHEEFLRRLQKAELDASLVAFGDFLAAVHWGQWAEAETEHIKATARLVLTRDEWIEVHGPDSIGTAPPLR